MGRILYVISSFDRGQRLGKEFTDKLDKMDFILMMLDEMREACEVSWDWDHTKYWTALSGSDVCARNEGSAALVADR